MVDSGFRDGEYDFWIHLGYVGVLAEILFCHRIVQGFHESIFRKRHISMILWFLKRIVIKATNEDRRRTFDSIDYPFRFKLTSPIGFIVDPSSCRDVVKF